MVRSKNTGKGKATSSSMERAVKKRKVDTSSESKEESDSKDEEIEAMFAESLESERERWV